MTFNNNHIKIKSIKTVKIKTIIIVLKIINIIEKREILKEEGLIVITHIKAQIFIQVLIK